MPVEINPALPTEGLPTETEAQVKAEETVTPVPEKGGEAAVPQAAEPGEEELGEEPPKRKGGWQRKIEKQDRELEFLRDQNRDLLARVAPHKPNPQAPSDMPDPEKFQGTIEEYKTALKAWNDNQIIHAKQQAAREIRIEKFGQELKDLPPEVVEQADDIDLNPELGNFLADKLSGMKNGKDVYIALVSNPDILEEYQGMDGYQIVASLSAISHQLRFAPKSSPETPVTPKAQVSRAPEPIKPAKKVASPDSNALSDDLSPDEWAKRRNAQIRSK